MVCPGAADQKIALLGAMQSLFEGSMYTFVFLWTPALSPKGEHLPHGMIFSCFMVRARSHHHGFLSCDIVLGATVLIISCYHSY